MSIILGALALLSALICINPVFGEDKIIISLEQLRWTNRILLVFVNEDADSKAIKEMFAKHADETNDRDIRFFIINNEVPTNGKEILTKRCVTELKAKYDIPDRGMTVILIGKDGGEKYRKDRLDLEEVYRVIDVMPMRIQEMRSKRHP